MSRVSSPAHSRQGSSNAAGPPLHRGGGRVQSGGGAGPTLSTRLPPSSGPSTSSTPRGQSPAAPPTATPAASRDVSRMVGTKVRLTLAGGAEGERNVEGNVWCYDSITGVVVLETASRSDHAAGGTNGKGKMDYRLVKVNQVKAIDILSVPTAPSSLAASSTDATAAGVDAILAPLRPVNIAAVQEREANALKAEDSRRARMGVGVSRWAQEIFDALGRTLPVRWHQSSIVIMDELMLSGPLYRPEDVKAGAGGHGRLDRVRQVLEGERAKLVRTEQGRKWEAEAAAAPRNASE